MSKLSRGLVAVGSLVALTFGMSPAHAVDPPEECDPTEQDFSPMITNQYAPMYEGQESTFFGMDDKVPLGLHIEVTDEFESFYQGDVITRVVRETEWADKNANGIIDEKERIIEISDNYFAQTDSGTVCYFGEDVMIFNKGGKFKGDTSGSWRADESGNAPGIFMPADPQEGETYQAEVAPGVAEDVFTVKGFDEGKVLGESVDDVMEVEDCNPLEGPDSCGTKFYAPGYGLVVDGPVELTEFDAGD